MNRASMALRGKNGTLCYYSTMSTVQHYISLPLGPFDLRAPPPSRGIRVWSAPALPFLNHHFYADDTQLFFFFHPLNINSSITHLQNALQQISAKLLTLNSSKTEFVVSGLKKQLYKIHNFSVNTTHSAHNRGFIFDEHLTFSKQILALSISCYYHVRQLRCVRSYLDSTTAFTIATSVVHSKRDYCNSLYYNLSKSYITCLQHIQNVVVGTLLLNLVIRSLHWLKITERIEYKLL